MKKFFKDVFLPAIIIFVISTLIHSFYEMLPNGITLIFFPINESIWEHMKMIFSSYMLYYLIIILFFNKKLSIFRIFVTSIFNIIIFLIMFVPFYMIFGEVLVFTLTIYFISILLSLLFNDKVLGKIKISKKMNNLTIIGIIVVYLIFTYLSYYPINISIFKDTLNNKFGTNKLY